MTSLSRWATEAAASFPSIVVRALVAMKACSLAGRAAALLGPRAPGEIAAATAQGFPRGRRPGALSCGIVRGGATGEGGCARCETCYWPCVNGGGATMTAILDAPI